jgi:maleylacetate reductase
MFDIPHGEAACVLLPHILRFNAPAVPDHFALLARAIGVPISEDGSETADRVVGAVATFIERLGLPTRLSALGVEPERLRVVAEYAMQDFTMGTNPRLVESPDQLMAILEAAL